MLRDLAQMVREMVRTTKPQKDDDVAWWVDSGATIHVCKDRCWFKTYESVTDGSILHMGNESTTSIHGRDRVDLSFSSGKIVSLFNVLHVPQIRKNLVSSSMLNNCGYKQVIESDNIYKGRSILDGFLVLDEAVADLKRRKSKSFIFKVDFEKAFDSVNWVYLLDLLKLMGFGDKWVKWIEACFKSATVSILVNGSPTSEFTLEKGIRQGDPLSPYLFIIVGEGLNFLAKSACNQGFIKGVEIGADKILLSHLQYTDDTIFIGKWCKRNVSNVMKLLECFERSSGLKVNASKSVLYGIGASNEETEMVASRWGCSTGTLSFKYLGLPVWQKMNKLNDWKPVVDKIQKRLANWKCRSMSFGGRLTPLKSALSSLPLYFSLFRAPSCVINLLESMRRKVLLGRVGVERDALWVNIIKSIYGREGGLGVASQLSSNSAWSHIINLGSTFSNIGIMLNQCFVKEIGDGSNTLFWEDLWCGNQHFRDRFSRLYQLESRKQASVGERICRSDSGITFSWQWVREPFGRSQSDLEHLVTAISSITFSSAEQDRWKWLMNSSGSFKCCSMANLIDEKILHNSFQPHPTVKNNLVPRKIEIFAWRTCRKRLPTRVELDKKSIDLHTVRCPMCDDDLESVEHAIVFCKNAMEVWTRVFQWWRLGNVSTLSIVEVFDNSPYSHSDISARLWQSVKWVRLHNMEKLKSQSLR
ncbi:uncharacterized protein [Rutidosis leptorrhynchoides]|uniref:uncharacterized protein n=1 Tax=Rutidosis leptorrhynchoides TaxID=125765 RepID=UPI003A9A1FB3